MSVINSHDWKVFRLGDLFDIIRGTSRTMRMLNVGAMPVIAAARAEQGVAGHYDVSPEYADAITVSCNGVGCGSVFYHDGQFAITGDASVMQEKQKMTREAKLFVAAICDSLFFAKYSYAEKCNPAGLAEELISLPATSDGQPDWAYMDAYMSEVLKKEEVFAEHLASLTAEAVADGHVLDTNTWRAFHLYDIFQIDMGNKFDRGKMLFGDEVNFVGRTGVNNGVNAVCGFVDDVKPYPAGYVTLALGGTLGACFLQNKPFYTSQNVIVLIPPVQASLLSLQFVSCVIWNTAAKLYSAFSNELNKHVKTDFVFYLPVTLAGEPDWAFMEQYMQQQMDKAEALVEHLDVVWN